jgi:DNA-binding response OmpR family regulator
LSVDTVLIIETDTDTITSLSDFLSGHGYLVDAVDDIEAARQKVSGGSPKLVVIGPQLGKSTGFLACSLIKKTPQAKGIPCVLLYTEREEGQVQRHQGLAGRAEVYLRKPFSLDDFRSAVSSYLRLPEQSPRQADEHDVVIEEEVEEYKGAAPPMVEEVVEEVIPAPPAASPELEAERDKLRLEVTKLERELDRSQKDGEKARDEAKKAREETRAAKETPPDALAEAERLRGEVGRLEKQLELAQKQAKDAAESATTAATAAKGKGGSDTRQILELKQTLNRREAELVDFKETSLQKEKQALELKGKLNDAEMKHVEFEDMIGERDREIASLKGQIEAVTADKDITAKRAEKSAPAQ